MEAEGALLLTGPDVADALELVVGDTSTSAAGKELARAYADLLRKLEGRGEDFRDIEENNWGSEHGVRLFECLRRDCPSMKDAMICYVGNPSGGFEACHWNWTSAGEGVQTYLQWENTKLCFKILVEAKASQQDRRSKAVAFLLGKPRAVKIERPIRLGSGRTMTVGHVVLPVRDEGAWPEVIAAVDRATEINQQLAAALADT